MSLSILASPWFSIAILILLVGSLGLWTVVTKQSITKKTQAIYHHRTHLYQVLFELGVQLHTMKLDLQIVVDQEYTEPFIQSQDLSAALFQTIQKAFEGVTKQKEQLICHPTFTKLIQSTKHGKALQNEETKLQTSLRYDLHLINQYNQLIHRFPTMLIANAMDVSSIDAFEVVYPYTKMEEY